MKIIFRQILKYYLKFLSKGLLLIHRPEIIVVAGSTNKTFVKNKIVKILKTKNLSFRANPRSFNTEIGLPLAILDLPSGYHSYERWLPIIFKAIIKLFQRNFPEYFVLELGVAKKGDMKYLLSIVKPKIAVICDLTQRYLESFKSLSTMKKEYELLAECTDKKGFLILNFDNKSLKNLKTPKNLKTISFGIEQRADFWAKKIKKISTGQIIKVRANNKTKIYKIFRFGKPQIYVFLIGLIIKRRL
ncbi:MAG: hypothetical protein GF335_00265 [Candidatus Moranbacteria bacterium]|nr:hypothetical protein [Candidatus Moranbacteria bacterium]